MNYLTIFLHYFSKPRFSEILTYFEIYDDNKITRVELIDNLLKNKNFQENSLQAYLYKAELQNFCTSAGIPRSGNKKQLWERIVLFLKDIDSDSVNVSKNDQFTEVTYIINNKEGKFRDASEMFKFNALLVVHRLIDNWKYDRDEQKAVKALKRIHPEITLKDCKEEFIYALAIYKEAMEIVKANAEVYWKDYSYYLKSNANEEKIYPFEKDFLNKYKKLNTADLWIFKQIFFWYHLK